MAAAVIRGPIIGTCVINPAARPLSQVSETES